MTFKRLLAGCACLLTFAALGVVVTSCGEDRVIETEHVFKTVTIGAQTWMAENLNVKTGNSWCYNNKNSNCDKYGRLYDWNTAAVACPDGWHLPSVDEWHDLISAAGDGYEAFTKLKSTTDWKVGTDEYGFSAQPGGTRGYNGRFYDVGIGGHWWTATEAYSGEAFAMHIMDDDIVMGGMQGRSEIEGLSVRCIYGAVPAYKVTILRAGTGAIGGGSYTPGTKVTITVGTAPDGQQFKNWETNYKNITFANADSATTTFTMPAGDVLIEAVFEPSTSGYAVTVLSAGTGASGNGNYPAGALVTINAGTRPMGQQFINWTATSNVIFANADSAKTTFTMPANAVTVTANFLAIYTLTTNVSPSNGGTISCFTGACRKNFDPAETPVIFAEPASGYVFEHWIGASTTSTNPITITMDADKTLTAVFGKQTDGGGANTFTDTRDNKTYNIVTIGSQTWMAENLNYATSGGSWGYDDNNSGYDTYGRLYDWNTAMTACPNGWHLPSKQEWDNLTSAVGGYFTAGEKLKSTAGWFSGNGKDIYGFSALPGGYSYNGIFQGVGDIGDWWTSTVTSYNNDTVYYYSMDSWKEGANSDNYDLVSIGNSVRCVQNDASIR